MVSYNNVIAYKSLNNGLSTYQKWRWPLPKLRDDGSWRNGRWVELEDGDGPVLCARGFHGWRSLEKAKNEGLEVYEMEIVGPVVNDDEKVAGRKARLKKLLWQWEPVLKDHGLRNCLTCGKPHDSYIIRKGEAAQWNDLTDHHPYNPEPWAEYAARLNSIVEKITAYQAARKQIVRDHPVLTGTYSPVVPAFHPFRLWPETGRCGDCGIPEDLHEGWEEREKIMDEYISYDRYDLMLVIQDLRSRLES